MWLSEYMPSVAISPLSHNEVHGRLMALKWTTVLTTNYDNCLESASGERFVPRNLQRVIVETESAAGTIRVPIPDDPVTSPRSVALHSPATAVY